MICFETTNYLHRFSPFGGGQQSPCRFNTLQPRFAKHEAGGGGVGVGAGVTAAEGAKDRVGPQQGRKIPPSVGQQLPPVGLKNPFWQAG